MPWEVPSIQSSVFHMMHLYQQLPWEAKLVPGRPLKFANWEMWQAILSQWSHQPQYVQEPLLWELKGQVIPKGRSIYEPTGPARPCMCTSTSTSLCVTCKSNCQRASGLLRQGCGGRYFPWSSGGRPSHNPSQTLGTPQVLRHQEYTLISSPKSVTQDETVLLLIICDNHL